MWVGESVCMCVCRAPRTLVLVLAKRDQSPVYPKSCTHHFKIAERRGELFELENGGPDEAARAPARAAASPRYAQNADGDAAVAVAEQQEFSAFQLGQLELVRRQQSAVRRRLGQHRHRYTILFSFYPLQPHPTLCARPLRLPGEGTSTKKSCSSMIHEKRKTAETRNVGVDLPRIYPTRERANCQSIMRKRTVVSLAEHISRVKMTDHRHVVCNTITTKNRRRCAKVVETIYDERES